MEYCEIDDDDVVAIQITAEEEVLGNDVSDATQQAVDDLDNLMGSTNMQEDFVLDSVSTHPAVNEESLDDRLIRIRKELEEISLEIGNNEYHDKYKSVATLFNKQLELNYNKLSQMTANIDANNIAKKTEAANSSSNPTKLPAIEIDYINLQKITRLEAKLSQLEAIVGVDYTNPLSDKMSNVENFSSVTSQINQIYRQLILLQKVQSSTNISDNVESLFKKENEPLHDEQSDKRGDGDIDDTARENTRNDNLLELIKYLPLLPHITMRMKELSSINSLITNEVKQVNEINQNIKQLKIQQNEWLKILNKIDKKISNQSQND